MKRLSIGVRKGCVDATVYLSDKQGAGGPRPLAELPEHFDRGFIVWAR